jgi:hypothetical protein
MADQAPLPLLRAWPSVGRCVLASVRLLASGRVHQPRTHAGQWLRFDDGSAARVPGDRHRPAFAVEASSPRRGLPASCCYATRCSHPLTKRVPGGS